MTALVQPDIIAELRQPNIERPVRQLYENYFEGIVAQICVNGGNREDGADIFQEAVLVLIDKIKTGQFRGESSIKTFLSAIARNLWLHELRTRGRRKGREENWGQLADVHEVPAAPLLNRSSGSIMDKVMEGVGSICKKILTGFYYEEKSMRELLVEFDYDNEQVLRNRKSKCMKKLKELIANQPSLMEQLKTLSLYE